MKRIVIPYAEKKLEFEIAEENLLDVVEGKGDLPPLEDLGSEVVRALRHPIGAKRISNSVKNDSRVGIIVDDWTRPTPANVLIPFMLDELHLAGVEDGNIFFLYATGQHPATYEQAVEKVGREIAEKYEVVVHNPEDYSNHIFLGFTFSGTPVWVNKAVEKTDYLIGIGGIKPNDTPGWSGGCKIIMPGISGWETINHTHVKQLTAKRPDQYGTVENPVRAEIEEIGDMVGLDFILNVVWNRSLEICHVVAGDPHLAWKSGLEIARNSFEYRISTRADIAVVGAGKEEYLSEGILAATRGFYLTKDGGTIIVVMPCRRGWAREEMMKIMWCYWPREEWLKLSVSEIAWKALRREIPIRSSSLVAGFKLTTEKRHVVIVSEGVTEQKAREVGADHAESMDEALAKAFTKHGRKARVIVMFYESNLIPVVDL